jgi:hypothetical protein
MDNRLKYGGWNYRKKGGLFSLETAIKTLTSMSVTVKILREEIENPSLVTGKFFLFLVIPTQNSLILRDSILGNPTFCLCHVTANQITFLTKS